MEGAAGLAATAALRAGAGYVRLSMFGGGDPKAPDEVVRLPVGAELGLAGWEEKDQTRFRSMVIGPGLSTTAKVADAVRSLVVSQGPPLVVDGDGPNSAGRCQADGGPLAGAYPA